MGFDHKQGFTIHWESWVTSLQVKGGVSSTITSGEIWRPWRPVAFLKTQLVFSEEGCSELMYCCSCYTSR